MLNKYQSKAALEEQQKRGYSYYKIYYNRKLAGYFAVQPHVSDQSLFISKFYVSSEFRGLRISTDALKFIEHQAKGRQLSKLYLTVNKNNTNTINIYKHKGFCVDKEVVTPIGEGYVMDDYLMHKEVL